MDILRKTSVAIAASLLAFILFTTGLTWSLYQVLGKPDNIKTALQDSGLYDTAVSGALDQAQKQQKKEGGGGEAQLPVNRDDIRGVIEKAVPPDEIQAQTEGVIDNVYAWLQGDKPALDFTIDLATIKTNLINGLGDYASQRLRELPACPAGTPVDPNFDPYNAACLPAGMDPAAVGEMVKADFASDDFLKDTQITASDLKGDQGKPLGEQLSAVPTSYQAFSTGVYVMLGVALLLSLGVVFLSSRKRDGLRRLSVIFVTVGGLSAAMAWVSNIALKWAVNRFAAPAEDLALPLQEKALKAVYILSTDLRTWWMTFGIILLVVGVAVLVTLHFTKPKDGEPKPANDEAKPEEPSTGASEKPADAEKPKPKPKAPKKLVQ